MQCDSEEDYSSDEDEDYLPSDEASEVDSEGDDEEKDGDDGGVKGQLHAQPKKGGHRRRQNAPEIARRRTGGISLPDDGADANETEETEGGEPASLLTEELGRTVDVRKEEQAKQKADNLWSSFLMDVGQKPRARAAPKEASSKQKAPSGTNSKDTDKADAVSSGSKKTVTITKIFEFAGEEVKVTEEVSASSQAAKRLLQPAVEPSQGAESSTSLGEKPATQSSTLGGKRPGGGLSSVLGLINKKPKLTVLEKSRLDWTNFTTTEGITDDLKLHNKGKEGYIEKQKFLQQADQRQYEKERELRMGLAKR